MLSTPEPIKFINKGLSIAHIGGSAFVFLHHLLNANNLMI